MKPWIGVDFDGTLVEYDKWRGAEHVGAPIPKMVDRVKAMLTSGEEVRIFTARVFPLMTVRPDDNLDQVLDRISRSEPITPRYHEAMSATMAIQACCQQLFGQVLTVTCVKDYGMTYLYDDRAIQVIKNTGTLVKDMIDPTTRNLLCL